MSRLVIISLIDDDLAQDIKVTVEIRDSKGKLLAKGLGKLPICPHALLEQYQKMQSKLRSFVLLKTRIKIKEISKLDLVEEFFNQKKQEREQWHKDCQKAMYELENIMNDWLKSESFRPIQEQLNILSKNESILILLCCSNPELKKLPWHLWQWLDNLKAEIVLSPIQYQFSEFIPTEKARILVILGNSEGIDTQGDLQILVNKFGSPHALTYLQKEQKLKRINLLANIRFYLVQYFHKIWLFLANLPKIEIELLINPTIQELNKYLFKYRYDILCFFGHSETDENIGKIYINESDCIEIENLKNAIKEALTKDLKLVIFNSCDGLGLAYQLQELNIPNLIVMRDIISDEVAQHFLSDFIQEFVINKKPLHLAEGYARKKLQGLEKDIFPCASLMPILFQKSEEPQFWANWVKKKRKPRLEISKVMIISLIVTCFIMVVRFLGFLQTSELNAYDHLMSQRPPELIDERILVVEITEDDTNEYGYPLKNDAILAQLISKLEAYQPRIIGLDLHRYQVREPGRKDFIQHFQENSNLFIVCSFGSSNDSYLPPPELINNDLSNQLGFSDLIVDNNDSNNRVDVIVETPESESTTIRRQLLSYDPTLSPSPSNCSTPYSLSFRIAYRFLYQEEIEGIINNNQEIQFNSVGLKKLSRHFGGYQNLDGQSNQMMINYRSQAPGQKVRLKDVLNGFIDPDIVKNKIVLIGYTADVARDNFNTPLGKMPGIWIHAHQTSQIISSVMDKRPQIWVLPQWGAFQWGDTLWVFIWSILGGLLAWSLSRSPIYLGLVIIFLIWSLDQICLFSITKGLWLPLIPSCLSLLLTALILTIIYVTAHKFSLSQEEK